MGNRIAIIDMGTNTFHLLVAEYTKGKPEVICKESQVVKIGKDGINNGTITQEGADRALKTIGNFRKKMNELKVTKAMAFGTSAFRNAGNGEDIIREIKKSGIEARIISGEEEAELIYLGVRSGVHLGEEKSLIIDIGGGSVEFIIANQTEIFWRTSLDIGGQRLLEKFQKHDPILKSEIEDLDKHFEEALKIVFQNLDRFKPTVLVGSSGTFDTLSAIYCFQENIPLMEEDTETPLTFEAFYRIYNQLIISHREERMSIPGMIEMRVDMIVVACCLIRFIVDHYYFQKVRVSAYALKEGILASLTD
jgi:exopolyphosphatase/guanosine-5'-triphosphate,3'-diphosphate pyrophosphatase